MKMILSRFLARSWHSFVVVTGVLLLTSAAPRFASGNSDLPAEDQKTLTGYHLTLEKLDQFDATNQKIAAAMTQDPLLVKELGIGVLNSGKTLADALSQFDSRAPRLAAILKANGMTERDYVLISFSVMLASTGESFKKYAPDKPLPAYISADNVALAEKNPGRFQAVMTTLNNLTAKRNRAKDSEESQDE